MSCTGFALQLGPVVVTRADRVPRRVLRGAPTATAFAPFPVGARFTLDAVGAMFHRTPNAIRQLIFTHRAHLDPPEYWQPRRGGDWRLYRVLSERDVAVLRDLLFHIVRRPLRRVTPRARQ